jgi:hypothetical protein
MIHFPLLLVAAVFSARNGDCFHVRHALIEMNYPSERPSKSCTDEFKSIIKCIAGRII